MKGTDSSSHESERSCHVYCSSTQLGNTLRSHQCLHEFGLLISLQLKSQVMQSVIPQLALSSSLTPALHSTDYRGFSLSPNFELMVLGFSPSLLDSSLLCSQAVTDPDTSAVVQDYPTAPAGRLRSTSFLNANFCRSINPCFVSPYVSSIYFCAVLIAACLGCPHTQCVPV